MTTFWKLKIFITADLELYDQLEDRYFQNFVRSKEKTLDNPHFHYYVEILGKKATITKFIREKIGKDCAHIFYAMPMCREQYPL